MPDINSDTIPVKKAKAQSFPQRYMHLVVLFFIATAIYSYIYITEIFPYFYIEDKGILVNIKEVTSDYVTFFGYALFYILILQIFITLFKAFIAFFSGYSTKNSFLKNIKKIDVINDSLKNELRDLRYKFNKLEKDNKFNNNIINEDDLKTIKDELLDSVKNSAAKDFIDNIKKTIELNDIIDDINNTIDITRERLLGEILSLGRKTTLNLLIGITITALGLAVLFHATYFGISINYNVKISEETQYVMFYISRVTLVIFIEVFAFFFLKLYKNGLSEIKYFQNELTNIEMTNASLNISIRNDDKDNMNKLTELLLNTERNLFSKKANRLCT